MGTDPTGLNLHWSPFGGHGSRAGGDAAANAFADLQTVAGLTAEPLRFGQAPDNVSLSTSGQVFDKSVVSEVTTIVIRSSSYTVKTESAASAADDKAAGTALDTAANGDGSATVATADSSNRSNNTGSIAVETVVTYSDGSQQKSSAALGSGLRTTGDGLPEKPSGTPIGPGSAIRVKTTFSAVA